MATFNGVTGFKGKINGLSFYYRKGVPCIRRPGGFTKARLAKDLNLRRLVQHQKEFGAQSMASKSLRMALAPLKTFSDGSVHNRLMKLAAKVTSRTQGKHGERPVAFSHKKSLLRNFQLNMDCALDTSLIAYIESAPSHTRTNSRFQLDLEIARQVTAPQGATHFRIVHALAVMSDIEYEQALGGFVPVAYKVDGKSAVSYSEYISLEREMANIILETALPIDEVPANATVVEVVGIEFYELVDGVYYDLTQGKAAKVVAAF